MLCRSVQVERPSCSTSGGQSSGREREEVAPAGGVVFWTVPGCLSFEAGAERAMAIHEETEVQERHLCIMMSYNNLFSQRTTRLTASHPDLTQHPSATASSARPRHPAEPAAAAQPKRPKAAEANRSSSRQRTGTAKGWAVRFR